ncbi:uncharacterized protein F5Z01DRAFT_676022 [Emericellopsis atlantica]|uniref:Uncharacterized protein n=1 Tax=Emericellopsis atlantica TaxID=2614577 RepID=A0A9P7ZJ36_9HYPO|nr:uncharacterized protein F5Z01DRAFT_676022 [Emericellopsis atlantica]KAG9252545.1 hypothetical protein F5Z01DRAFT_676022 [Emericellopsis atlantica]
MRGLMPLALSPAGSAESSPSTPGEQIGIMVDDYFPEILAKDLQRSNSTSGYRLSGRELPRTASPASDCGPSSTMSGAHRSVSSPYHGVSGARRCLGPIQERNSVVSFLEQQNHHHQQQHSALDEDSSDEDSFTDFSASKDPVVRALSFREQSIITAATSLASSTWVPSPSTPPCRMGRGQSWIEADSEDEGVPVDETNEDQMPGLSPRPPSPPASNSSVGSAAEMPDVARRAPPRRGHRKSYSIGGLAAPRRRPSARRPDESQRAGASSPAPDIPRHATQTRSKSTSPAIHRQRASSLQTSRHDGFTAPAPHSRHKDTIAASPSDSHFLHRPTHAEEDDDLFSDEDVPRPKRSRTTNTVFIRPSPPPSPLPSVQSWLNGSTQPYTAPTPGDDLPKAVPLPPNVVETLRVSIACFPETMLLTDSLTVETIRNYAKKVRQPTSDALLSNLQPDSPNGAPRKSLWKRAMSYKRSAAAQLHQNPRSSNSGATNLKSPSTATLENHAPKTWTPLKHVFGCCSDYILDALWAHVVAYNCISALVPRLPAGRAHNRLSRPPTSHDKEEIPKKAASLLGLAASPDNFTRKFTSQLPWGLNKETMVTEQSAKSINYDNTTRDIQAGLMRCIMRLIATARLMSENGSTEDRSVEVETGNVDVLFTRSLCEIVRIAEDNA